jgi:hypothetical protein
MADSPADDTGCRKAAVIFCGCELRLRTAHSLEWVGTRLEHLELIPLGPPASARALLDSGRVSGRRARGARPACPTILYANVKAAEDGPTNRSSTAKQPNDAYDSLTSHIRNSILRLVLGIKNYSSEYSGPMFGSTRIS